jgi:long-chain acyl-CoA synthetase
VVVGDARPQLGALVEIDATTVGDWAAERGGAFTTFGTLATLPEVRELVGQAIDEANAQLDERDRVACFAVLPQQLADDEELVTATGKVRRGPVLERFRDLVDRMYSEQASGGAS